MDLQAMERQTAVFDAGTELTKQRRRLDMTAIVDDDYPSVRFDYERAQAAFVEAIAETGNAQSVAAWKRGEAKALSRG